MEFYLVYQNMYLVGYASQLHQGEKGQNKT